MRVNAPFLSAGVLAKLSPIGRAVMLASAIAAPSLLAQDIIWTGDSTADWYGGTAGTDTGWDTNDFPLAGDDVIFPSIVGSPGVMLMGTAPAVGQLGSLDLGDVPVSGPGDEVFFPVLFLDGVTSLATSGNMQIAVGAGFFGEMRLTNTSNVTVGADLILGEGTGAAGSLMTSFSGVGANTTSLTVTSETFLGRVDGQGLIEWEGNIFETGSLFIADSGVNSVGQLTFGGTQLTVTDRFETGVTGFGTFNLSGTFGPSSADTKDALFGVQVGSEGNAMLFSSGWEIIGQLRVGLSGKSRVDVNDNATVTITTGGNLPSIYVGETATAEAQLNIEIYGDAGGGVTANHQAIIGVDSPNAALRCGGSGSLTSAKHTSPSGASCIFGANVGSSGSGVVENGGTLNGDGATVVGFSGTGYLEASNSGWLNSEDLVVAREPGSTGNVLARNDGRLSLENACYIGGSPTTTGGTGIVTLDLDGELFAGTTLLLHSTGELRTNSTNGAGRCLIGTDDFLTPIVNDTVNVRPDGTVSGNGKIVGKLLATGGAVEPGLAAGKLSITGDTEMRTGAILGIEIGGATAATQYDVLDTDATFTFAGATVKVSLIGGFVPVAGQTFKVIDAATYAGTAVVMDLTTAVLPPPLAWNTSTLTSDGTLRVDGPTPAAITITAIRRIPSTDDIELTIRGNTGAAYFIQSSLNLLPPWTDISGPRVATGSDEIFVVTGAVAADPKRFFRLAY